MQRLETNFDGLVGPTHNFAGLAHGNLASARFQGHTSSPKRAALQGLEKMRLLVSLGVPQGILIPHARPNVEFLRLCGFSGSDSQVLESAWKTAPRLARVALSASSMWVANACTVSVPRHDNRVHFTPANLAAQLHRATEPAFATRLLRKVFADSASFEHHPAIFGHPELGDEGAANHMALWTPQRRMEVFVYGRDALGRNPQKFMARQTREASQAVARQHGLKDDEVVFLQQNPDVIDAGVFHNDVIAVSHENFIFAHEMAFEGAGIVALRERFPELEATILSNTEVPVADAVTSYVFNSQVIRTPSGDRLLIAPTQSQETPSVAAALERLQGEGIFKKVIFQALDESMRNGGGPACLRLRVPLSDAERLGVHAECLLDDTKIQALQRCVETYYPDTLDDESLRDPKLIDVAHTALDNLTQLLNLGAIYDFQRGA